MLVRFSSAALAALLLAGCGGSGGTASLPPAAGSAAARQLQSSNVDLGRSTLWYGGGYAMRAVPLEPGGATAQIAEPLGNASQQLQGMTVAPDGTVYDLETIDGGGTWVLNVFAPGSQGVVEPEERMQGTGEPLQVVLVGDGIDVLSRATRYVTSAATLSNFVYAPGRNFAPPIRRLALGPNVLDVASDPDDRLFVGHADGGVAVYAPRASGAAAPDRTVTTSAHTPGSLAVAPDGTLYVEDVRPGSVRVYAYARNSNGPAPAREIGPFADAATGGSATGGITVDASGNLYVGFRTGSRASVGIFGPTANGQAMPARSLLLQPDWGGFISSIAIGPAAVAPLYVAGPDRVDVFPLTANGTVPISRTITGFVAPGSRSAVAGIATAADGTLDVVVNDGTPESPSCRGIVESPYASGSDGAQGSFPCGAYQALAIARGSGGEIVTLLHALGSPYVTVQRSLGGTVTGQFTVNGIASSPSVAVAPNGNIVVSARRAGLSNGSVVAVYSPSAAGNPAQPLFSYGVLGTVISLAFGPDGTLYTGSDQPGDTAGTYDDYVYAYAAGIPSVGAPSHGVGPFPNVVSALACDDQGNVYAGIHARGGGASRVKTFGPQAFGAPPPFAKIANPLPTGESVVGLAIGPAK
jgi:hypothetical protein